MAAPVINITNSPGLTLIDDAESTTGWSGFNDGAGGTPSVVNSTELFVQNTASNSAKISGTNQNKGIWFDVGATTIDFTVTGRHLYIWMLVTTVGLVKAIADGGIYIKVASDASGNNWSKWYVAGSDTYSGGWVRLVIDCNKTPSLTAATAATISTLRWFGVGLNSTGTSTAENLYVDRMDYGDGLQIEAGDATDPANWEALFTADDAIANKYGIIQKLSTNDYTLLGGLAIGDASSTATTLWNEQSGAKVTFLNPVYWVDNAGMLVSAIDSANLYKIDIEGNGTGTTDVDFGTVVGSGDDRQGVQGGTISSAGPAWTFDAETDIADLDTVNLYGVTFERAGVTQFSSSTKTDLIGCTFFNCGEVQPNTAEFLNNTIIAPCPDRGLELVASHNVKQITFVADASDRAATRVIYTQQNLDGSNFNEETEDFNDAGTGDVTTFTGSSIVGDYFAVGHKCKFEGVNIDVGTARSGGTLVWEYWSGSAWSSLTTTDGTNTLSTTGANDVTWDAPSDWATVSLQDEDPLYYVRLRATSLPSTNPVIDQGFIIDVLEHHLHVPSTGTYTLNGCNFFGFGVDGAPKWMGENSSAGLVTINVSDSTSAITDAETDETAAGSTTVVNTVTVRVTALDANTLAAVSGARVLLEADTGGDLPSGDSVTITHVTTTATVAHTAHGMVTGQKVAIRGANQQEYNGVYSITVTGANAYTYVMGSDPGENATGTITSTAVILDGVTNGSGVIEDTAFDFTSAQPTTGVARKNTTSPRYKTSPIIGSIVANVGLDTSTFMVSDE